MTTMDLPASAGQSAADRRRTILARSAVITIFGPAILYALYLILLAPAQYHTTAAFAVRGSHATPADALGALGISTPTSTSTDARVVEDYIVSQDMVGKLKERYGFTEAYSRFSLDPFSFLPGSASSERATAFWRGKVRVAHDTAASATTVQVAAYTPEDALRLTQGVLTISEELINTMSDRSMRDLVDAADREIERKREAYEASRDRLAEYQGTRFSGVEASAPAQQAMSLVGSLDAALAEKRTELASMSQTFQPGAPQMSALRREIAALEAERAQAVRRALTAPGEQRAGGEIEAQAALMDYEFAQRAYHAAVQTAENARQQALTERKYVVAYIPPHAPEVSNWWRRLGNVFAVLIGSALLWGVAALIYSIIRDHME